MNNVAVGSYEIVAYKTSAMSRYSSRFNIQEGFVATINLELTDFDHPSATPWPTVPLGGSVIGMVTLQNRNPII